MAFTQDAGTAGKKKKSVEEVRKEIQAMKNRNAVAYSNRNKTGGKYEPLFKRKSSGTGESQKNYTVAPNGQKVFKRSKTGTPQPTNPNIQYNVKAPLNDKDIPTYEGTNQKKYNIWNGEKHYVRMKKVGGEGKDFMSENEKKRAASSIINAKRGETMRKSDVSTYASAAKQQEAENRKRRVQQNRAEAAAPTARPRESKQDEARRLVAEAGTQSQPQVQTRSYQLKGQNQTKKKKSGGKKQAKLITSSSAGGNVKGKNTKAVIKAGFNDYKTVNAKKKGKKKKKG